MPEPRVTPEQVRRNQALGYARKLILQFEGPHPTGRDYRNVPTVSRFGINLNAQGKRVKQMLTEPRARQIAANPKAITDLEASRVTDDITGSAYDSAAKEIPGFAGYSPRAQGAYLTYLHGLGSAPRFRQLLIDAGKATDPAERARLHQQAVHEMTYGNKVPPGEAGLTTRYQTLGREFGEGMGLKPAPPPPPPPPPKQLKPSKLLGATVSPQPTGMVAQACARLLKLGQAAPNQPAAVQAVHAKLGIGQGGEQSLAQRLGPMVQQMLARRQQQQPVKAADWKLPSQLKPLEDAFGDNAATAIPASLLAAAGLTAASPAYGALAFGGHGGAEDAKLIERLLETPAGKKILATAAVEDPFKASLLGRLRNQLERSKTYAYFPKEKGILHPSKPLAASVAHEVGHGVIEESRLGRLLSALRPKGLSNLSIGPALFAMALPDEEAAGASAALAAGMTAPDLIRELAASAAGARQLRGINAPLLRRLGAYAGVPTYLATTLLGPTIYGTKKMFGGYEY